jgi:hypothetical protein
LSIIDKFAFYLPQFHPCDANDKFWEKGFTDWVTTRKASPIFQGHFQPRIPGGLGYYNLSNKETIYKQVELANKFEIKGFAIYHYWFDQGVTALSDPIDIIRRDQDINIDYFICWVNADWTRSWIGDHKTVIFKQSYKESNYLPFFKESLKYFQDNKYLKIDNRPVFYIHDPSKFDVGRFIEVWDGEIKKEGFDGFTWIAPLIQTKTIQYHYFDYLVGYPPGDIKLNTLKSFSLIHKFLYNRLPKSLQDTKQIFRMMNVFAYDTYVKRYREYMSEIKEIHKNYIPTVLPGWDNTPRYRSKGFVLNNSSPELFSTHVSDALILFSDRDLPFMLIKAWNEWAEGNILEPDERFGCEYLNIFRNDLL